MAILPKPRQRKRTPATGDKREAILEVAGGCSSRRATPIPVSSRSRANRA